MESDSTEETTEAEEGGAGLGLEEAGGGGGGAATGAETEVDEVVAGAAVPTNKYELASSRFIEAVFGT